MSDYTQITSFAPKDALTTGNPAKKIRGSEFDPEFAAIAAAIATKYDSADIASNAEAAALSSDAKLITPAKLLYALQNGSVTLGASVLLNGGIAATDVVRKSTVNTLLDILTLSSTSPRLVLTETDGGTNTKNWIVVATSNQFGVSLATDAAPTVVASTAIAISRTGTTATQIDLTATSVRANGSEIWTAANDGPSSGLNADLLDNLNTALGPTGDTVVIRDSSGDVNVRYLNSSASNSENPTVSQFMVTNGSDNLVRKASLAHVQSQLGMLTLASGTWTPSITANSGSASAMSGSGSYIRVGNTVHAKCQVNWTWSGGAGDVTLDVTLPVASNLGGALGTIFHDSHIVGAGNYQNGDIGPDTVNDRVEIHATMLGNGSPQVIIDFMYQVA